MATGGYQNLIIMSALYDFDARGDDELTFKEGNLIQFVSEVDKDWIIGELGERRGKVPRTYIEEIPDDTHPSAFETATAPPPHGIYPSLPKPQPTPPQATEVQRLAAYERLRDTVEDSAAKLDVVRAYLLTILLSNLTIDDKTGLANLCWGQLAMGTNKFLRSLHMSERQAKQHNTVFRTGEVLCQSMQHLNVFNGFGNWIQKLKVAVKKQSGGPLFEQRFGKHVKEVQCSETMLPIPEWFKLPTQQMTTYQEQIQRILDCTPEFHGDYDALREALSQITDIIDRMEAGTSAKLKRKIRFLNTEDRFDIAAKQLLYSGTLTEVKRRSSRELNVYLLNDRLLLTQTNPLYEACEAVDGACRCSLRFRTNHKIEVPYISRLHHVQRGQHRALSYERNQ